jgi:hypothetical protein
MTDSIRSTAWLPTFTKVFLPRITIASKELRSPGPIVPYRAQKMALTEIAAGLERGVHHHVILKARQLGISTVLLALDIFWLYMNPGLQGAFVCDTEPNRENFRQQITMMMGSLPKGFRIPITKHDRNMLVLKNGSVLQYLSAGKSKNTGLGRSRALNFVHASELSQWGDPKGYETLMDTLALENENRLYLWESTALGFNLFHDCWMDAVNDPLTMNGFFIGWWAKDIYRFPDTTPEYEQWWTANPLYNDYEQRITQEVYKEFGWEINPEQWAWYRWKSSSRSDQNMMEEFPSTADEAFQETGSPYFNGRRLTADIKFIKEADVAPIASYTYVFGDVFLKTRLRRSEHEDEIYLRVWENPIQDARYVIGVDPAYGSSEEADRTVISVWRCFADKLVQVAEYVSPLTTTQNCAWALAHLAGEYRDSIINLEIQGGGGEVMKELDYLKKSMNFGGLQNMARDMRVDGMLDSARWFLYSRIDNVNPRPAAYNTKMTVDFKPIVLNRLNDAYSSDQLIVRSLGLLDEMVTLKRDGDKIRAGGRNKDDRVIAAALANYAWKEWVQSGMMSENRTWEREMRTQLDRMSNPHTIESLIIPTFLQEQAERRESFELSALIDRPFDA